MKKVIAALLCICMAAGLIGCGSGTAAPDETNNSAESSTEDSAEGDAETEQAQEEAASNTTSKTTITLLSWYTVNGFPFPLKCLIPSFFAQLTSNHMPNTDAPFASFSRTYPWESPSPRPFPHHSEQ